MRKVLLQFFSLLFIAGFYSYALPPRLHWNPTREDLSSLRTSQYHLVNDPQFFEVSAMLTKEKITETVIDSKKKKKKINKLNKFLLI